MKNKKKYIMILCFFLLISSKIFPQDDMKLDNAYKYFEKENYQEALKIFLELDKKNYRVPQNTKNQIGLCYRNLGKTKEAIKWFNKALGEAYNNEAVQALIHSNLGEVYIIDGQKKLAKKHFLEAEKLGMPYPIEYKFEEDGWYYICHSERDAIFFKPESMKKIKNQIYRVWTKWIWDEDRFNEDDFKGMLGTFEDIERRKKEIMEERKGVYTSMQLEEYDCRKNRTRLLNITEYNKLGVVLSSSNFREPDSNDGWNYIIPGSIGDNILQKICKGK